jgi:two-component system, OmpR family, KDP operon response regulator KdpE
VGGSVARLLIVDDDALYVERLSQALAHRGYAVWGAYSGQQALALAQALPLDVALLDLRLPDMSGHALAAELRARWQGGIIMLSAVGQEADVVQSFEAGADDHLTKPFALDELLARITALLRRRTPATDPQAAPYVDDELFFDPARRLVERAGRRVSLSPIEYALLALLIARRDQAVSKDELIRAGWPEPSSSGGQTLAIYIANLRQKVERDPRAPRYLLTSRGVGYRFVTQAPPRG